MTPSLALLNWEHQPWDCYRRGLAIVAIGESLIFRVVVFNNGVQAYGELGAQVTQLEIQELDWIRIEQAVPRVVELVREHDPDFLLPYDWKLL
jgi:hypothetical protein